MKVNNYFLYIFLFVFFSCDSLDIDVDRKYDAEITDTLIKPMSQYMVVFGDIQSYTLDSNSIKYFEGSLNWIKKHNDKFRNINIVLHVGDVTWTNEDYQWSLYAKYVSPFSQNIPFVSVTGNHDYTWDEDEQIQSRESSKLTMYSSFNSLKNRIVESFDTTIDNIIVQNEFFGKRYDIIALEFGPRKEVVDWALDYVGSHPDDHFILLTHEWLNRNGQRISNNSYAEYQLNNLSTSTPEEIWTKLVYPNNNVVCVICGHNGFSNVLFSKNKNNRDVPQVLFNLQYIENGGDGLIELWEFTRDLKYINISVIDTKTNLIYNKDECITKFSIKL